VQEKVYPDINLLQNERIKIVRPKSISIPIPMRPST
jgi:hypothetical protein